MGTPVIPRPALTVMSLKKQETFITEQGLDLSSLKVSHPPPDHPYVALPTKIIRSQYFLIGI